MRCTPMVLVVLAVTSLIFPPIGLTLLAILALCKVLGYVGRDGGINERRRLQAISDAGPSPITDPIELRLRKEGLA